MARLNLLNLNFGPRTHEGAPARNLSTELQLRRSVLACLLWESQFYEDGVEIAGRIAELVPKVAAEKVAALAVEAREQMKLRHAPLLLVREMARHATHRGLWRKRSRGSSSVPTSSPSSSPSTGRTVACRSPRRSRRGWPRLSPSSMSTSSRSTIAADPSSCATCCSSARQASRRGAGEVWKRLIAGDSRARHVGGCLSLWRRQARGLGASAPRAEAGRSCPAPQPAQHA